MVEEDFEHLASAVIVDFLGVARIGNWFLLGGIDQSDVTKCADT
jgi:hypothetical protein